MFQDMILRTCVVYCCTYSDDIRLQTTVLEISSRPVVQGDDNLIRTTMFFFVKFKAQLSEENSTRQPRRN